MRRAARAVPGLGEYYYAMEVDQKGRSATLARSASSYFSLPLHDGPSGWV